MDTLFYFRLFIVLVAFNVSGCTTSFIVTMMEGPTPCPADVANETHQNKHTMSQLRPGHGKDMAAYMFAKAPERIHTIHMLDHSEVEAHFYRVRQPDSCVYAEKFNYNLRPVFFKEGVYIGQGYDFYYQQVSPYKKYSTGTTNVAYLSF